MEDATKKNLSAIPDEVLDAIAGGSMNESERAWFLDWAADMKERGKGIEWTADRFCDMAWLARRDDITKDEIRGLLDENWDSL